MRKEMKPGRLGVGGLLVVEGLLRGHEGGRRLLRAFGLGVEPVIQREDLIGAREDEAASNGGPVADLPSTPRVSRPILAATGGTPILRDGNGVPVYSEVRWGRGVAGVFADSLTLSKAELGSRFAGEPTESQRGNLDLSYWLLRRIVEPPPPAAPSPQAPSTDLAKEASRAR